MKRFSILAQALVTTLIVSACGVRVVPQATSTVNPVDLQVTALLAASTIMAETQAAIPTTTPPRPTVTDTAAPALTLQSLPTFGEVLTVTPGGSPVPADTPVVVDPCINTLLPDTLTGKTIQMRIKNPTDATVMLTVVLQRDKPQDVCGYRSYSIPARQTLSIGNLVEGCYSLWAWNPDPKDYFIVTNGTNCLNSSKSWAFDIVPNGSIQLRQ